MTVSLDRQEAGAAFDPEKVALDDDWVDDDPLDPKPVRSGGEAPVQLGANIAELRRDAGLRIDELAERAGMTRTGLEHNEAGKSAPNVLAALKLADSLGVSIDRLTLGLFWNRPVEIAAAGGRRARERLAGYFSTRPAHLSGDGESPLHVVEDQAEVPAIIGANLRDARRRRRLPQGGLGVEQTHVSRIELGLIEPALGTLIGLARELEIPIEGLMAGMIWGSLGPPEAWEGPAAAGRVRRRDARSLDAAVARGRREGRGNVEIARSLGVESDVIRRIVARLRAEGRDVDGRTDSWTVADVEEELALRRRENGEDPADEDAVALMVAENIRTIRDRLGRGQESVSRDAGFQSQTSLSRLERRGVKFSVNFLIRLAASMRVPCSALTEGVRWDHAAGTFMISRHPPGPRPTDAELIGQNARRIRRAAGLSESTVARRVGRRGRFFNALELGGKLPKPISLLMLARALEVEVGDLLVGVRDWYVRPLPPPEIPTGEEAAAKAAQQERLLRLWDRGDDMESIGEAVDLKPQTVFGVVDRLRDVGVDVPYRKAPTDPAQLSARLRRRRGNRAPVVR